MTTIAPTEIGSTVDQLDTPALCVDLDVMEANIARMAGLCRQHGVAWRPHTKAVKTPAIAQKEVAAGAIGVTCAKLGEAEVMAAGGIHDILVANQIFGPRKMERLVEVCRGADLIVTVDHPDQVRAIGDATHEAGVSARAIVEVDIGLHRAGVAPGTPALELGYAIEANPGLEWAGIMGYEGHLLTIPDPEEKEREIRAALGQLIDTRDAILAAGLPCPIVSAGGTGSYAITITQPGITELQAGGLIFMDAFYRQKCHVEAFDFALKLVCTVVSRPAPERAVIDAGRKSVHADHATPLVVGHEHHIRVARLSAEHGELELDPSAQGLKIGDRLELIPGYSDMTNVLHNQFYGIRDGRVEAVWPLLARGKLQ